MARWLISPSACSLVSAFHCAWNVLRGWLSRADPKNFTPNTEQRWSGVKRQMKKKKKSSSFIISLTFMCPYLQSHVSTHTHTHTHMHMHTHHCQCHTHIHTINHTHTHTHTQMLLKSTCIQCAHAHTTMHVAHTTHIIMCLFNIKF